MGSLGDVARTKRPYLERLVINVTHDCNLRCTYCYADTGAYGEARGKLSAGVGEEIVESFFSRFEHIRSIQLFGGESLSTGTCAGSTGSAIGTWRGWLSARAR